MNFKEFWHYLITDPKKQQAQGISADGTFDPEHPITTASSTKKLGNGVILFILINSILGSSLFYLPGLGMKALGPASIIAWIIIFMIAGFVMLYIGELMVLHPTSGGTYGFCQRAYGRFIPFMAGWLIWLTGNLGMALNVVAAAEYFIPAQTQVAFYLRIAFSIIWIVALNYMAYRSIDAGATMLVTFGVFSLGVVSLMIIPSFIDFGALFSGVFASSFNTSFLEPFVRFDGVGGIGGGLFSHMLLSLLFITEAFFGFEAVTYMANEAREPKELHKILFKAIIICGIVVVLYIFSTIGTVAYGEYVTDARPFAVQALHTMGQMGQNIVVFGMYLVIIGATAAWPIAGSRLLQAMARDKLHLKHFAKPHPKHNSPYRAVYFQTVIIFFFTWFIFRGYAVKWGDPYRVTYLIYVVLSLIALSIILFAVPKLRRKEPDVQRVFKAPLPTIGPIVIVAFFILLIVNWVLIEGAFATAVLGFVAAFIFLGIPFFLMIEMYYDPKAIVRVNEVLSYVTLATEGIHFPLSIRKNILKSLGDIRGRVILEYGCSVGSLTKRLAKRVTEEGRIYATDITLHNVKITDKRTKNLSHVFVNHHPGLGDFTLQLPTLVDDVVSVGVLSYMQDPLKLLTSLAQRVKKGGRIIFVDYDKFFYFIPNVQWIESDEQLQNLFAKAGFRVKVNRKKSLFWTYVIIIGRKL
jgi:basic amino acid/polyamine antiporter, APA family